MKLYGETNEYIYWMDEAGVVTEENKASGELKKQVNEYSPAGKLTGMKWEVIT